ncbi:MAG: hypothetical protein WBQ18_05220 [Solirubrobacteraceae bacterium]
MGGDSRLRDLRSHGLDEQQLQRLVTGVSSPDKLDCAKAGVRVLLNALRPCPPSVGNCGSPNANPFDSVGMLVRGGPVSDYRSGAASSFGLNATTSNLVKSVDWGQCPRGTYPGHRQQLADVGKHAEPG